MTMLNIPIYIYMYMTIICVLVPILFYAMADNCLCLVLEKNKGGNYLSELGVGAD